MTGSRGASHALNWSAMLAGGRRRRRPADWRFALRGRPERGPVYVLWSETGAAPPGLDYGVSTGETVTLAFESDTLRRTYP